MAYSTSQIAEIKSRALSAFRRRLDDAFDTDSVDELLESLGIELEETNQAYASYSRRTKIYVLGELAGRRKDYVLAAKKLNINEENLEFYDYSDMKSFNTEKLRYSPFVSDIICGPVPHKIEGIGDHSSILSLMEHNPQEYPKVYRAIANRSLKLSINSFKQGIIQSRLRQKISQVS